MNNLHVGELLERIGYHPRWNNYYVQIELGIFIEYAGAAADRLIVYWFSGPLAGQKEIYTENKVLEYKQNFDSWVLKQKAAKFR